MPCALVALAASASLLPGEVAPDPQLIPVGTNWRFLTAASDPSLPVTAWRELDFDDSAWASGPAGFSSLGDEATTLPGASLTSAYFRVRFELTDPASVRWLVLRMDYSDGFVAYLNGQEIARRGLTNELPAFDAVSTAHPRGATEEIDISSSTSLLVDGTNLLAIQLHGATVPPTNLVLVAELCANFQRGPYVQNVTTNAATILWRTPVPASTTVEYGTTSGLGLVMNVPALVTNHEAQVTGLMPDTEYFYRIRSAASSSEALSPVYGLRTLRSTGDVSFAVMGDSGSGQIPQFQVASALSATAVDLVLHVGDTVYPVLKPALADQRMLSVYTSQMRGTSFFPSVGNHDLYSDSSTFFDTFRMPTNSMSSTSHFYSFDHGDVHYVSLFVPTFMAFSGTAPFALRPDSTQMQWLTNDLAATTRPWRVLFLHSPLLTSGPHRFDDFNGNAIHDRLELQQWLLPVAAQYGVQLIFSGHDHFYERFKPVQGVHCFVTGGGGMSLYGMVEQDSLSQRFESRHHFLKVSVRSETLTIHAIDRLGIVFDSVEVPRVSPPQATISMPDPARVRLRWNSSPGTRYAIEKSVIPTGSFAEIEAPDLPITASGYLSEMDLNVPDSADGDAAFFRIRVVSSP